MKKKVFGMFRSKLGWVAKILACTLVARSRAQDAHFAQQLASLRKDVVGRQLAQGHDILTGCSGFDGSSGKHRRNQTQASPLWQNSSVPWR